MIKNITQDKYNLNYQNKLPKAKWKKDIIGNQINLTDPNSWKVMTRESGGLFICLE